MTRDLMTYVTTTGIAIVMAALAGTAWAGQPNYPPQPTVIEYTVDPAWPKRPAEFGPRAAVPGIAVDRQDRIWCLERCPVPVQVYTPHGELVKSWGQGQFKSPHSLRFDGQGNVWITDHAAHVVKKYTPEGQLLLTLGTPGKPGEDEAHFNGPTDVAITPTGDVFVSDGYGNRRVVHFDAQGKFMKAWGKYGAGRGQFCLPHQIVLDARGVLYVADRNAGRIQVFDQQGKWLDEWNHWIMPWGLCMTARDELWACGSSPQAWYRDGSYPPPKDALFLRISTEGKVRQIWTVPVGQDGKEKPGDCNWLHAVAVDSLGNLYAGDINGKRIQKFVRYTAAPREDAVRTGGN
jgi:peptidylamidoglycolate lyase